MNQFGRISICGAISTYNVKDPPKSKLTRAQLAVQASLCRSFCISQTSLHWLISHLFRLQAIKAGEKANYCTMHIFFKLQDQFNWNSTHPWLPSACFPSLPVCVVAFCVSLDCMCPLVAWLPSVWLPSAYVPWLLGCLLHVSLGCLLCGCLLHVFLGCLVAFCMCPLVAWLPSVCPLANPNPYICTVITVHLLPFQFVQSLSPSFLSR